MSHAVNLQSLLEDVLLLEHVAYGSRQFCESNGFTSFEETGYLQPLSPRTLMKGVLCERLISVSIKGRVLLEHVHKLNKAALKRIEKQATVGLRIAYDSKGSKKIDLRESFNKVIHAAQVTVDYAQDENDQSDVYFWDGQIQLVGTYNKEEWSVQLNVPDWCKAVRRVVVQLINDDHVVMLGWDGGL